MINIRNKEFFEALLRLPALEGININGLTNKELKELENAAVGAVHDYLIDRVSRGTYWRNREPKSEKLSM